MNVKHVLLGYLSAIILLFIFADTAMAQAALSPATKNGETVHRIGRFVEVEPLTELKIEDRVYRVRKVLVTLPDPASMNAEQKKRFERLLDAGWSGPISSLFLRDGNAAFCLTRQSADGEEQCLALTPWDNKDPRIMPPDIVTSWLHVVGKSVIAVIVVHTPTPTNVDIAILDSPLEGGKSIGRLPECVVDSLGFVRDPVGRRGAWKGKFGAIVGQLIEGVAADFDDSGCRITVKGREGNGENASGEVRFFAKDHTWQASGDLRAQYASDRVPPKDGK